MPQGLQVWDASGNLILDTSTRLGRILGWADIGGYPYSGSIALPTIEAGAQVFVTVYNPISIVTPYWASVYVAVVGSNIDWSVDVTSFGDGTLRLIYGVY